MGGAARGLSCAAEAARLLRRRPGLLLLGLALGVLTWVEPQAGDYIVRQHTGWGRDEARIMQAVSARQGALWLRQVQARARQTIPLSSLVEAAPWVPSANLLGTSAVLCALVYGKGGRVSENGSAPVSVGLYMIFEGFMRGVPTALIAAFLAAGYLGLARTVAAGGSIHWRHFASCGRKAVVRMLVYSWVEYGTVAVLVMALTRGDRGPLLIRLATAPLLVFTLAISMTPFIIIDGDVGVFVAIKRSASVIARDLAGAAIVIGGAGLLNWLCHYPYLAYVTLRGGAWWDLEGTSLQLLPYAAVVGLLHGAIGAWFCVAAFLWYRQVGAPEQRPQPLPQPDEGQSHLGAIDPLPGDDSVPRPLPDE